MIYHIVRENEYRRSVSGGIYAPASLSEIGFVHCALEVSVISVANDYFSDVSDTLLLFRIDPSLLQSETRYEKAAPEAGAGTGHLATSPVFPHVYGPIDCRAITGVGVLRKGTDGYLRPAEFIPHAAYFGRG